MKKKRILTVILVLLPVLLWVLWANTALEVNTCEITGKRIPDAFSGFRIAQISDLHNAQFGEDNQKLLALLGECEPDIIVITGDLVDSRRTEPEIALSFCRSAVKIAPVYYVTGNHESRIRGCADLLSDLEAAGVAVLRNQAVTITREGKQISLLGLQDPSFRRDAPSDAAYVNTARSGLKPEADRYTVLLSHRPELFDLYVQHGIDLVFSGHAHGGQFRLPLIGGLIAPNQGLFPNYDAGLFTQKHTTMLVSRGVGNSIFPVRFCNRPEIVVAILKSDQ